MFTVLFTSQDVWFLLSLESQAIINSYGLLFWFRGVALLCILIIYLSCNRSMSVCRYNSHVRWLFILFFVVVSGLELVIALFVSIKSSARFAR